VDEVPGYSAEEIPQLRRPARLGCGGLVLIGIGTKILLKHLHVP